MKPMERVVILGGGSAGWMAAAMLARMLGPSLVITLVESEQIGTVGVGEAAIPPLQLFNQALGLSEAEFMSATAASIKLGIQFEGWGGAGERYMHAFGQVGKDLGLTPFHHYWLQAGEETERFWDYSLNEQAARAGRVLLPSPPQGKMLGGLVHAYHFDAHRYAQTLRRYSERLGVRRVAGEVVRVPLCPDSGQIQALELADGQRIEGELFIDCSGFAGRLIEQALGSGFEDWGHWLPCDRAWAVPCEGAESIAPYTRSIAREAGWQWQIPLQHRIGNGLVFSSRFQDEQSAKESLLANLPGKPLAEPKLLRFRTGRRRQPWLRNCVALGLASGFLEPLESTSIHLVQSGIMRLLKLFPNHGPMDSLAAEYNRQSQREFEQVRDFLILHYHLNRRDEPLWQHCRSMSLPDSLSHKLVLFAEQGRVLRDSDELFTEVAWVQVMLGQGLRPQQAHPLAAALSPAERRDYLGHLRTIVMGTLQGMPSHRAFLQRYCPQAKE